MPRTPEQKAAHAAAERRRRAANPEAFRAAVNKHYALHQKAPEPEPWPEGMRRCGGLRGSKGCGRMLPVAEFPKASDSIDGYYAYCRECSTAKARVYRDRMRTENPDLWNQRRLRAIDGYLAKRYGMTREAIEELRRSQDNRCAICLTPAVDLGRRLAIDHDHACCDREGSCGKCVRGLLCDPCNSGLARFRDDPKLLRKAATYLTR